MCKKCKILTSYRKLIQGFLQDTDAFRLEGTDRQDKNGQHYEIPHDFSFRDLQYETDFVYLYRIFSIYTRYE